MGGIKSRQLEVLEWRGPIRVISRDSGGNDADLVFLDGRPEVKFFQSGSEVKLTFSKAMTGERGLYYVLGDHPVHGLRSLLYLGLHDPEGSQPILSRWEGHRRWLSQEWDWRLELFWAPATKEISCGTLEAMEGLLIASHQPIYNSSKKNKYTGMGEPFTIWNTGCCPRLLPEVSADHPWNCW